MSAYDPHYAKRWRVDRDRGITRYIDPEPARQHVQALMSLGASRRAIADAAGTSTQTICKLLDGQGKVTRRIAAPILAVTARDLFARDADDKFVPKVGAVRRIQALMVLGHRAQDIAAVVGKPPHLVHNIVNQSGQWITRSNYELVATAYDHLWDQPGRSSIIRGRAAANGWAPPLAWDDDTIDDPTAQPFTDTEPRHGTKRLHLEDLEFLLDDQPMATVAQLADRLEVTRDAIQQACRRAGRTDLLERLARNAEIQNRRAA